MPASVRQIAIFGLALLAMLIAVPAASAQTEDTPVGGLQQLDPPNDCVSTQGGEAPECGTVISGGTTDAVAIAITPDGRSAYVASSGDENPGSLATFTRNPSTGALSFNACVRDPSSAETCATEVTQLQGASHVVATNRYVYVASSGSDAVRAFSRNESTGALTPLAGAGGCIQEIGAGGCQEGDGLDGVGYLVLAPDGLSLYAVSPEQGTIALLRLDPDTGAIAQAEDAFEEQEGVRAAAISPDGANLYAVSPSTDQLVKYDRDASTGELTPDECWRDALTLPDPDCTNTADGLDGVNDVVVVTTGSQSNVYTVSREQTLGGSTLTTFDRSPSTGDLSAPACVRDGESSDSCSTQVSGIRDATSIAARPDGEFVYVTGRGDDAIAYFARNATTGALTQYGGADEKCVSDGDAECGADGNKKGLSGVNEAAITQDGRFLYSTADGDDAVAAFAIQYAPVCEDVTRDDVPAQTEVDIQPDCSDVNEPADVLTIEVVSQPAAGAGTATAEDTNADGRADTLHYDPGNFIGTTTFTYRAVDDQGNASAPATVTVTVTASGAPVISVSDAGGSEADGSIAFTFQRTGPTTERITVTYSTENDTAVAPGDYTALTAQTVVFAPNETTKTVTVAVADDEVDEVTERFRVRITSAVESAGPDPAIADDLGVGTIADDDTAVVSVGDASVVEDGGPASVTVTLSRPSSRTVEVTYSTGEGSATEPEDFRAPEPGVKVSFAPGDTSETITIPIVDDAATETTEQFTVTISDPSGGAQLGDATGQVTIADDDEPSLSIGDASVAEGDSGTRSATFTVALSAQTSSTVTVSYATSDASATAGSDYEAASGTLTFQPGQTSKTVTVPVSGDTLDEADETFTVELSGASNATIADGTGQGTIENDDRAPAVSVGDASVAEGDSGTRDAAFTVSLSEPAPSAVTVDYATSNGTATAGSDFDAASGTVAFAAGETSTTVNVAIRGDSAEEGDETFALTLSNPSGATIGDGSGTGRILNDDRAPVEQPAPRTTIVVGDSGVSEGDSGVRPATFTVALSQPATSPVSVEVATAPGSALAGSDFRAFSGRLTFAPGETTKAVPVDVLGDATPEGDEQFTLRLSGAAGADIARAVGTGTIANDDIEPRLPGLRFTVAPARDLTRPHVFTVTGRVVLPAGVGAAEGCGTGYVSAQYKNGGNTISTRRTVVDAQCRFRIRTPFNVSDRLRNARRLKLVVRFLGNRYLTPRTARAVYVRVR